MSWSPALVDGEEKSKQIATLQQSSSKFMNEEVKAYNSKQAATSFRSGNGGEVVT